MKSASNLNKTYTIKLIESPFKENKGKLILYCTCPSWKFGGKTHKRVCKHIKQFLAENVHPNTRRHLEAGIEGRTDGVGRRNGRSIRRRLSTG